MNETLAREEICRVGASLFARGLVHATAGNISVRLDDGFLITPTDACLGFLDPAALSRVDAKGRALSGATPSKTLTLHRAIYEAAAEFDPQTRCVIHTHSTHCVALSMRCDEPELLKPLTPYFVMKVGHVPLLPYQRPGAPAAAEQVAQLIARYGRDGRAIRAVMLQRLGPNVWHDTPATAMAVLEELEETARLAVLAPADCAPLGESQIDELRRAFNARW
jgi:ribulose-5-phosphate 4-epimerase/fuculose-1-phosphate aldolase